MEKTDRSRVKRKAERGEYDDAAINAIVDEALVCHVGFVDDGGFPVVIPTIHARVGDALYLHGSRANRMLRTLTAGAEICVTITLIDGLVLARSVFHHSMNYRSVVVFGVPRLVQDRDEKLAALEAVTEHVARGRWADARHPNETELKETTVVAVAMSEASAKIRNGPVGDEEDDYALSIWAGIIPITTQFGAPETDARMEMDVPTPGYAEKYSR